MAGLIIAPRRFAIRTADLILRSVSWVVGLAVRLKFFHESAKVSSAKIASVIFSPSRPAGHNMTDFENKSVSQEEEFRALERESQSVFRDFSTGLQSKNKAKNRYSNVIAQEQSRVKLIPAPDEDSDYINANHFGTNAGLRFILTQAPLPSTFGDFWKMIWQQDSRIIVMLTTFHQGMKGLAEMYWPAVNHSLTFGEAGVTITNISSHRSKDHHVSTSFLRLDYLGASKEVTHLQVEDWPDFGVPSSTASILHVSGTISKLQKTFAEPAPVTLHCSAGLGRTGTFAAIHTLLQEGGSAPDIVRQLRLARPGSVQTLQQYRFISRAVSDHWRYGTTLHKLSRKQAAPASPPFSDRCAKRVRT